MTTQGSVAGASPTLDQRRAKHAWEAVQKQKGKKSANDYAGEAKKLPIRIMAASLGQALAFIAAKAKKKPGLTNLLADLTDWVIATRPLPSQSGKSLLEAVVRGNSGFLRRATDETLAYLQWLNRFAEAEGLKTDEGGDE